MFTSDLFYGSRLGMRVLFVASPQEGADAWANSAGAAQTKFTEGVQKTQVDVVGRAIASQAALLSNFTEAITSGRWARRLTESGGTANWKAKTVAKAQNFATGIAAAKPAYLAAAQRLYPYIAQGQQMIDAMPSGTLGASKARATAWIDFMAAYKNQS